MRDMIRSRFVENVRCHGMSDEAAEWHEWDRHMSREGIIGHRGIGRNEICDLEAVNCAQAEDLQVLCLRSK